MAREINQAPPVSNRRRPTSALGPGFGEIPGPRVSRALAYLAAHDENDGFSPEQSPTYVTSPEQRTSAGAYVVHARQFHEEIPVFMRSAAVRFSPGDEIIDRVGSVVPIPRGLERPGIEYDAAAAVRIAAKFVATPDDDELQRRDMFGREYRPASVDASEYEPAPVSFEVASSRQVTTFEAGPFDRPVRAELTWFPLDEALRLCWMVDLYLNDEQENYIVLVDVASGEVRYAKQRVHHVFARGLVYVKDASGNRRTVDFPPAPGEHPYPFKLPANLPSPAEDWISAKSTVGNCVQARLLPEGTTVNGTVSGSRLIFDADPVDGPEQQVVNIFYLNGFMHDFFYRLGFREEDGNFQQQNFGRGGSSSDRVDARAYPHPVWGTASMSTPADGSAPTMKMGLVEHGGGDDRHTAFDASVVFHEFTHGVTNRLVGGPDNVFALEETQSGGMGEGWGDYIACTILEEETVGSWVVDDPLGIRNHAYTSDYPSGYGDVGTAPHDGVHGIGEIWCATLVDANREVGATLMVQLVVDALKLSPANPSFLDARDAIFLALDNRYEAGLLSDTEYGDAWSRLWAVFAKFGMGVGARSVDSGVSGIVADEEVPEEADAPEREDVTITSGGAGTVVLAGRQFSAEIGGGETVTWYTGGWPTNIAAFWSLHPTTSGGSESPQLEWKVSTERMSDGSLRYWIEVVNLTSQTVRFDAHCVATQL